MEPPEAHGSKFGWGAIPEINAGIPWKSPVKFANALETIP